MASKYTIEVSITPLCSSCGKDLEIGMTQALPSHHPLERDNPYERTDRRVFVLACPDCFVHKSEIVNQGDSND